jgi:hypothetical protein
MTTEIVTAASTLTPEQAELQARARAFVEAVLMPLEVQAERARAPARRADRRDPPRGAEPPPGRRPARRRARRPGLEPRRVVPRRGAVRALYELAHGTWDSRRGEVARQFIDLIERFAPGFEDRIEACEVLGPPEIEERIGLTGGNIFQGEVTPDQMWEQRLTPRTPDPGLYLCGAATHPGGSVIALNGRNGAMAVLADARELAAR